MNRRGFLASLVGALGLGAWGKKLLEAPVAPTSEPLVLRGFDGPVTGMQTYRDRLYISTADSLYSWDGNVIELVDRTP